MAGKMEDETAGVMIEEFLGLKPKMYSYLVHRNSEHKKKKVWIETLLQQFILSNIKMFCWVRNDWYIQLIGFKVKIIK